MKRVEWIVCKGCGRADWLDVDVPMNQTGWESHLKHNDFTDAELRLFLCSECGCYNCSHALHTTEADEGGVYPSIDCEFDAGYGCVHLQSSDTTARKEE